MAAVAGPLERRVRLAREVVESLDRADQASESKEQRDKAYRSAAKVPPAVISMGELSERLGCVLGGWPKPPETTQAEAHG